MAKTNRPAWNTVTPRYRSAWCDAENMKLSLLYNNLDRSLFLTIEAEFVEDTFDSKVTVEREMDLSDCIDKNTMRPDWDKTMAEAYDRAVEWHKHILNTTEFKVETRTRK